MYVQRDQAYGTVVVTPQEVAPRLTDNRDEVHRLGVPEYSSVRLLGLPPGTLELPERGHVVVHDVAPTLPLSAFRLSGVQTQLHIVRASCIESNERGHCCRRSHVLRGAVTDPLCFGARDRVDSSDRSRCMMRGKEMSVGLFAVVPCHSSRTQNIGFRPHYANTRGDKFVHECRSSPWPFRQLTHLLNSLF